MWSKWAELGVATIFVITIADFALQVADWLTT